MNGSLYNNDNGLYFDCLNNYMITFNDGTVKYTRAKCKSDAADNVSWFGDVDRYDDIISIEELNTNDQYVGASEDTEFWPTDVKSVPDIAAVIIKAMDAGTSLSDIEDYLIELENSGNIGTYYGDLLRHWASVEKQLYRAGIR